MIPIAAGNGPGIIIKIKSARGGSGGEFSVTCVEKETVSLVPAERSSAVEEFVDFIGAF